MSRVDQRRWAEMLQRDGRGGRGVHTCETSRQVQVCPSVASDVSHGSPAGL